MEGILDADDASATNLSVAKFVEASIEKLGDFKVGGLGGVRALLNVGTRECAVDELSGGDRYE